MSIELLTLTELRQELQRLNIDVSTGSLRGEQRKAELLQRLKQAKPNNVIETRNLTRSSSMGESKRIPMNELRTKCEAFGLSTVTPGISGEARYQELVKRISMFEVNATEAQDEDEREDEKEEGVIKWGMAEDTNDIEPSVNWGNKRTFIDDDEDEDDEETGGGGDIIERLGVSEPNRVNRNEIAEDNKQEDREEETGLVPRRHSSIPSLNLNSEVKHIDDDDDENDDEDDDKEDEDKEDGDDDEDEEDDGEEEDEEEDYDDYDIMSPDVTTNKVKVIKEEEHNDLIGSTPRLESNSVSTYNQGSHQGGQVMGASYFASLLTPRLKSAELQKRLRAMKREMRNVVEKRSSAIGMRSNGEGADLDVLTAESQHRKVQAELLRIKSEESEGRCMFKSKLVEAGKKMSFADLQFKLSTLEVSYFKQLTDARKKIVREENKDVGHGTEAEMAMNAQIVVLTRALTAAKEEEEKEKVDRYEDEKAEELGKLKSQNSVSTSKSREDDLKLSKAWQPPQGPPIILDNPLSQSKAAEVTKDYVKSSEGSPSKRQTPGEILLQKALKMLSEDPNHAKKKKLHPDKVNDIENMFLEAIKYARVSTGQTSGLLPRVLMHWGSFIWHQKDSECLEEASQAYIEACDIATQNHMDNTGGNNSGRVLASVCAEYAGFLSKHRELDKAEKVYLQGISADATHPRLLGNYARLLTNRGEYARADALYCQALDNSPMHGPTMINRAQLLKVLGKLDEAEELLRKAAYECSDVSHRAQGANNLANFLWKVKGNLVGAKQVYIDGIKAKGPAGDKLLQRNYSVFLSRNKEMRGNTKTLSEFIPGRRGGDGLDTLEEAEDPYDEMSTLDASVIKRIVASNKRSSVEDFFEED